MPRNNQKPEEGGKAHGRTIWKFNRVDVRSLVDKEWEKKSRDDVPPSKQPMPKNPLLFLKPHKTDDQGNGTNEPQNKD